MAFTIRLGNGKEILKNRFSNIVWCSDFAMRTYRGSPIDLLGAVRLPDNIPLRIFALYPVPTSTGISLHSKESIEVAFWNTTIFELTSNESFFVTLNYAKSNRRCNISRIYRQSGFVVSSIKEIIPNAYPLIPG